MAHLRVGDETFPDVAGDNGVTQQDLTQEFFLTGCVGQDWGHDRDQFAKRSRSRNVSELLEHHGHEKLVTAEPPSRL